MLALFGLGGFLAVDAILTLKAVEDEQQQTNAVTEREQSLLEEQFESATREPEEVTIETTPGEQPAETVGFDLGDPFARIIIEDINLEAIVVEGTGTAQLRQGPGHYVGTPLPGQPGNVALAGHRTTYGMPFHDIDRLEPGDEIILETIQGERFTYEVTDTQIVLPTATEVIQDFGDSRLTLTSCHPKDSSRERIVVTAHLVTGGGDA